MCLKQRRGRTPFSGKIAIPKLPNFEVKKTVKGSSQGQSFIQTYISNRLYKGLEKWRVCIPAGGTKTVGQIKLLDGLTM